MNRKWIFFLCAILLIANTHYGKGGYDEALEHVQRGDRYYQETMPYEALLEYNQALKKNDGYGYAAYTHYMKSRVYWQLQDFDEAVKECELAIKLFPKVDYKKVFATYKRNQDAIYLMRNLKKGKTKDIDKLKTKIYRKVNSVIMTGNKQKMENLLAAIENYNNPKNNPNLK